MSQTATGNHVLELREADFHQQVNHIDKPVLVDFWAPWCGPCLTMGPIIDEIAAEHGETVQVVKVNLDESPALAAELGISSIPTFLRLERGKVTGGLVGAVPKERLVRLALEGGDA